MPALEAVSQALREFFFEREALLAKERSLDRFAF
jgi:hypothetical protein